MAEEINTSEQDLGAPDIDLTQKSDPVAFADAVIQNLPSSVNLPAKPEAFDIYDKAVGNPLTGPPKLTTNGGLSNAAQVDALMDKAFKQIAVQDNPYSSLRPYTYSGDYDASNFDRYYSTEDVYSKLGFNPYRNNEALYNNKMTFGDQFSRAASQWDNLVATGFMSGVRSWGDMFTDPLAPDIKAARDMERYMAIGSSSTGGIGGFVTNTFLNSGYSIGIGLEFLAEELALMGVTALTGGLTSEITAPLMVNRGASAINKLLRGGKAATKMDGVRAVTNSLDDARSFWNTIGGKVAQGVFDIANPLDNTIKTLKATDYATDFASVSKTFGAFADDMLQIKQSVGEAKIEAGSTKLEVTEQLIQKYRDENGGEDPDEKELAKIDAIASQAAYKTAVWNLPAIMTSNKLMNATILAPLRKVMGNQTTKLVDDYIFSNKTFSKVGDGLLSQTKAAVKSLAKPKFYGQFGMNYLKANIAEGVQENLQEAIAIGAVEHAKALYTDPIRANYEGFMGNFLHGVKDQFSAEGAETFASGLLMGAFSQPVMAAPSVAISKLIKAAQTGDKYKALKALRDEQDKRNVNYLNETYQDALKFFAPDIGNASRTGKLAKDMYTAARMGDKNGTLNNRDAIANHHIITALRTGKFDIMMDRLKEYKKFNDQEIVEAFKKHGVEEQDVKKAAAMIDDVIARAEGIRNNYEQIANKYPNPFNPAKFRDGTPEKKAAQIAKAAWDEATHNVLFAGATFESHSKRIADIAKTFSKVSNTLAGQDAQSLMNLLSSQGTINEINVLRKEIAVLDDTLPDQKTLKVEKQKQLDAISNYYDAIASVKFARTDEERAEAEKKAKEAFGEYVRVLGKKNGKIIFNEALEEAYTLTKDSLLLKNDMDGLAQSLNVLMTPDNFFNLHTALNTSMTEAFDNKVDIISLNQEQFRTYQDINGVVEEITKESGLYLSEELISTLAQLKQKGIVIPEMPAFVDKEGNRVTSGPAYDKAKAIWDAYVKVARTGDIETIKSNYDPKALSTYPQGLIDLLREQYNKLDDENTNFVRISDTISFEDWAIADEQEKIRTRYFKYLYKSDFSSIDEKYKSMTLEELNDAITKLNQELEGKEPAAVSEDVEKQKADLRYSIQQLENDLANRIDALVKNGATLEEATKIGTKEFDESEGGKNRVALDKLKADLAALEQPTDIKAKKDDIERRRQEEYNTQYNALVAGQVLDNDGEPVYEEDKGISANRLSTLTDKKYGHGHIRTSGLNSLEVLEKLLDGSDFSGMFGEIGSGAYSTWESGKFIIVSNNINPTTNNKLNLNEIEIILNAGLSPFAQELANKYPNVIFKDFNGKKYDAELAALKVEPTTAPVSPRSKEEIESELRMVEDYLAYRLMMNVQMSNSQKEALMRMKAMTDAVENRTKENEKYVINGKKYDLRVTTFVYDLLKKAPYNYEGKTFTEKNGKELTDLAKKIFEDNPNKTSAEKINEWIYKAQNNTNLYNLFINRFDEDKINLMKSEMGPKDGFDKFKTIIDKYAYEEAREAGNTIDEVVRLFLSGSPISKPANMSAEAFNNLRNTLRRILSNMHKNGEIILAKNLVVTGELEVDGETKTIAGELDLLVIDKNGNLKIYDIKTGSKTKWNNYGIEDKDEYMYKPAYSLQLSMYKALIEQQTGLKVTTLKVIPLEITKDLKGNVKTLSVDTREKNVNHDYQDVVDKYVKKVSKRGNVPDPFVPVTQRKTGEQVPSLPPTLLTPLSKDEIDSRERNINALNYKIGTLQNKLETLGTDAADIEDTIAYLQNLLDNTVELSQASIQQLKDEVDAQMKILKDTIKSSTSAKTKRGQRILNTIESLKVSYRSEVQLLNDIHNRIADLKSELKTMKAVEKDLNTQIDFYEGLIASSKLRKLDIKELRAKRDALKGKVKTVQRLIDGITNAIRKSINYIKEYVKQVFSAETELKKFTDETKFKPLSTKELRALIDSNLEDDAVFLETYPKLKAEFERLENNVLENLDTVEMLEEVKASEEKRQEELLKSLEKYQNQIRYLDELIEGYKEVDLNKFGVPEDVVSQQPKPTANNQEIKDDTEKTLARQKKEVNESTAKKNEEGIVISVLNFVQNGPQVTEVSIEEMNANLTLDTLKLAKSKNYAILYNGAKYIIGDIGEKSVTLLSPEKPDVTLKEAELAGTVEIVEKESLKATQEEKDLLKSNNELVESTEKELSTTKETLEQLRQNFLNALC